MYHDKIQLFGFQLIYVQKFSVLILSGIVSFSILQILSIASIQLRISSELSLLD